MKIAVPYTTRPTMSKNTGSVFVSAPRPERLYAKYIELQLYSEKLCGEATGISKILTSAAKATGRPTPDAFIQLALSFEEDIVLLQSGRVIAACVCFPSGWVPGEKIGRTLTEIHEPVADNQHLVSASQKIAETICSPDQGSFSRDVWTITSNPHLSNLPGKWNGREPKSMNDLYFRTEHQTTLPIGDDAALFFINVDVVPLNQVWQQHGEDIMKSIDSMTPAVLEYKNLIKIREILNEHKLTR